MEKRKIKIEIKHWVTDRVLFSFEAEDNTLERTIHGADLRGANLYGADLREANLHEADLYGANLRGANLYGADLREANLHEADLYGANLYRADLREANLHEADLYGANLREANLYGADLYGANLYRANLHGADLYGANLYRANLHGANLYGADLYGADLHGQSIDKLPQKYVELCSRDILFVLEHLKAEVPFLKQKLLKGEVNGSQYEGDCACLVGSLANGAETNVDAICNAIPHYTKGLHNPGEQWFLQISKGDTPSTSIFVQRAVELCNQALGLPLDDGLKSTRKSRKEVA